MDWIIKTGTDSEGNAITTTLDCQISVTWEYSHHETKDCGDLKMIVDKVFLTYTATDTTTENASHLVTGQSDQTLTGTYQLGFFPTTRANGDPSPYTGITNGWTPHDALTENQMKQWVLDVLDEGGGFRLDAFKVQICHDLYGEHYYAPPAQITTLQK